MNLHDIRSEEIVNETKKKIGLKPRFAKTLHKRLVAAI